MKRNKQVVVLLIILAICTCFATTARAKDSLVLRDPSGDHFEERLAERQRRRKEVWDSYVIDWPDEKPIVSEDTCGLPGRDYDEKTVIAFAQHDLTPKEVIQGLDALETVELDDEEREGIDEDSVRHQFVITLTVREGHTVQEAIDELWECPVIEYADVNRIYYADSEEQVQRGDQVRRGGPEVTQGYVTYRNPEEFEMMTQRLKAGEITKKEWHQYYESNKIFVFEGVKPVQPLGKPGWDYALDELSVVPFDDATCEEVLAAVDAMRTVHIEEEERVQFSSNYQEFLPDFLRVTLNDGCTLEQGIDELWECPVVASVSYATIVHTDPVEDSEEPTLPDSDQGALDDASWERLYGKNRYATAAAVSAGTFQSAQNVVISCGKTYPDTLAASSLAGALSAPILVVPASGGLPYEVSAEISRLGATHAVVIGGNLVVSDETEADLKAMLGNANVERVYGSNRIGTCLAVAQRLGSAHSDTAIVVNGFKYPDALSAAAFSYASKSPLFLTKEDGTLTQSEVNAINAAGYSKVLLVGGTLVVKDSVKTQLAAPGRLFYRAWGNTRYATCAAVARWALGDVAGASFQPTVQLSPSYVCLATGATFADAFGAASAAGSQGGTLLLCADSSAGRVPATVLNGHAGEVVTGRVAGGTLAVPTAVLRDYMLAAL